MDISWFHFQDEETKALKQEQEDEEEEVEVEEEEEEEEAPSLCDLPLNGTSDSKHGSKTQSRRQSSDQSDLFEFFNDPSSDNAMSHAEDIIHCGKLVPYKQNPSQFDDRILRSFTTDEDSLNYSRRYCESLPELNPSRSNSSSSTTLTRSSRSLDGKKLRRNSSLVMKSEVSDAHRSFWKRAGKPPELSAGSSSPKPRWYDWVFGLSLKFPPEMEYRDMKNRQFRRNKQGLPPSPEHGRRFSGDRRSNSWGVDLISVLSCKRHANVAVTHSIRCYEINKTRVTITK